MSNKNKIITGIIHLPKIFLIVKDISIYSLLKKTGYFENDSNIDENDILKVLLINQNFISDWLTWSDNKRVSAGWFFQKGENNKYKVGYFPFSENLKQIEFTNASEACAAFIKREIEDIRNSALPAQ